MGVAAREVEHDVMTLLHGSGCQVLDKGRDGAGHQTVTFALHGRERTFHFGTSQHMNGCARRNLTARLRRVIREIPAAPIPLLTLVPPVVAPDVVKELPPAPTPPKPRLTAARRKEIAKRYITLRSIEALIEETGIPHHKLHVLLNSAGGDAQRLYRLDLNKAAQERARQFRESKQPARPIIMKKVRPVKKPAITHNLPELPPAKRGAYADNFRRDILITRAVYIDKIPIDIIAAHAGVTPSRISQIATANYQNRKWKF